MKLKGYGKKGNGDIGKSQIGNVHVGNGPHSPKKTYKVSLVNRSNSMCPQIGRKIVHKSVQISPVLYQKRAIVTSAKAKLALAHFHSNWAGLAVSQKRAKKLSELLVWIFVFS